PPGHPRRGPRRRIEGPGRRRLDQRPPGGRDRLPGKAPAALPGQLSRRPARWPPEPPAPGLGPRASGTLRGMTTEEERLELARELTRRLLARHGEGVIIAVGLHGT